MGPCSSDASEISPFGPEQIASARSATVRASTCDDASADAALDGETKNPRTGQIPVRGIGFCFDGRQGAPRQRSAYSWAICINSLTPNDISCVEPPVSVIVSSFAIVSPFCSYSTCTV